MDDKGEDNHQMSEWKGQVIYRRQAGQHNIGLDKHSIICNFNPALDSMETVELMPIGLQVHARQTPQAGIPSPT